MDKSIFIDYDRICSFAALLVFLLAERGVGKTYGATKAVINDFLKHGHQFVYLRRYKTELDESVPKFFDAIRANEEFPDHTFKVKGNVFMIDDMVAGYAIPLSTSKILKSTSFPLVRTIIFDEFTITTGIYRYLPHEVEDMLDLIETIGRMRDNIRVWFLGNSTTLYNPYFNYWNLSIPYESEYKTFQDGTILVYYAKNEAYREAKRKTKFGKLISGTKYGDFAIDNKFLQDSNSFVHKRPAYAKLFFNLKLEGNTFGIWFDNDGFFYVSADYDPDSKLNFAFTKDDHTETTILSSRVDPIIKNLIERYKESHLVFESMVIKSTMINCLLRYVN